MLGVGIDLHPLSCGHHCQTVLSYELLLDP
jgi:hypothetical protein